MDIQAKTFILASAERVYGALATAEGLNGWFTSEAVIEARPGGTLRFRWVNWGAERLSVEDTGQVVGAVRPKRIVWRWHPDSPCYTTEVEITFRPRNGGTLVELVESGFRSDERGLEAMVENAVDWGEALTLLKMYLEYGVRARWA